MGWNSGDKDVPLPPDGDDRISVKLKLSIIWQRRRLAVPLPPNPGEADE
jgi:hypothetical protein